MTGQTRPLMLGLVGPIGAGKDTAARYLQDQHAFSPIAFADPVRDMLGALAEHVDVDGAWLVERALKEQPMPVLGRSYRQLARSLGTEWGRQLVRADLWISIAEHKARQALARGENVLLTDVRYLDEASWLRSLGGRLVALQRDGCAFHHGAHGSEAHGIELQLEAEHGITNHSTPAHLYDQLDVLIDRLRTTTNGVTP